MATKPDSSSLQRQLRLAPRRWRAILWLFAAFLLALVIARRSDAVGSFAALFEFLDIIAILILAMPLAFRWLRDGILWRLRNKLVLTYLLFGLAPVVLFAAIFALAAYFAVGQFAIHLATARLEAYESRLEVETQALANRVELSALSQIRQHNMEPEDLPPARQEGTQSWQAAAFLDGQPLPLKGAIGHSRSPLPLPRWFLNRNQPSFRGMVVDAGIPYIAAIDRRMLEGGHMLVTVASFRMDRTQMDHVAEGLGQVGLVLGYSDRELAKSGRAKQSGAIRGGADPPSANLADISVRFFSSTPVVQWDDGSLDTVAIQVQSRPSLLYHQLFGTVVTDYVTSFRILFVVICIIGCIIELVALWMAMRLNRTVTHSVESLYDATLRIDSGDLRHRIHVTSADQMADLCKAFNRMSSSLERLLQEQKEKERLQNELSIAQEVQSNLFPVESLKLPTLELHGVCRPARSVSGDYYDFLQFHSRDSAEATGVGIALGDISGKGISAALLMATLHSAVRAYRFASEELSYTDDMVAALSAPRSNISPEDRGDIFHSPATIMSLLNRHLYRSTQPEKYATLFLAHYDVASRSLMYSNAGHLPPLILCSDGEVKRLTRGGTVVGLMDGMHYDEECQKFGKDDLLIAFSDGVTEPENDFGEFGEERLLEVIRLHRDRPLAEISARVLEALDAWIGAEEQPDDITLVLARGC